jgi:ABC-2 type transport system ATP-binding protein
MRGPAIVCENLSKIYKKSSRPPVSKEGAEERSFAVKELSLKVEMGELFGILGPNGAGKTTTIGLLTTRLKPTGGRAWVAGIDVVEQPVLARARLGTVTQKNTLDFDLSVGENLYFHGRYFGFSRAECYERMRGLLARFGLQSKETARVNELSGGEVRQVLIARALLHDPEVLFLDEPTSDLDPENRLRLWAECEKRSRSGKTSVLITHDIEEAENHCERIAIICDGELIEDGTPQSLKEKAGESTLRAAYLRLTSNGKKA